MRTCEFRREKGTPYSCQAGDGRRRQGAPDLAAAHPGKLRVLPFADLNEPTAIDALFDWLGLPATGRRLEILGTKVNPSPPGGN